MKTNIKDSIKKMLNDYLMVVREHYVFDTKQEKKEFINNIKDMIKILDK